MGQEHWLSERQLPLLQKVDAQFVARSGMEEAISTGIYKGRPYGGVSIAWSSDLNQVIKPIMNYKHKRLVAVELYANDMKILLMSVYMPFFDSSNRETCLAETEDTISMIELIISDHPNHLVVIGGDLNTELKDESPFDPLWKDLISKNGLANCSNFFSSPGYTYHHVTLGHRKFNDHFIVSQSMIDCHMTKNFRILEEGQNQSDHLPILMSTSVPIQTQIHIENTHFKQRTLK